MKENNDLFEEHFKETIKENIIFFPVRHHSPACSYHLKKIIEEFKPESILIEGPSNCNDLMKYMIEEDTEAPFCIYSSYIDKNNEKYRCYYPFLYYSPEFTAIKEALNSKIHCAFIDMPYPSIIENEYIIENIESTENTKIKEIENKEENTENNDIQNDIKIKKKKLLSIYDEDDNRFNVNTYTSQLTEKAGLRTFAELWERDFEIKGMFQTSKEFIRNVYALGYYMRLIEDEDKETRNREYVMAKNIKEAIKKYKKILVVTGSFHTKGIIDKLKESEKNKSILKKEYDSLKKYIVSNSSNYLIPYSFEDADQRKGYRAGIEFPAFYDLVYKELEKTKELKKNKESNEKSYENNPYINVVLSFIIKASGINRHHHNVSIPDCINAYYMAVNLAKLRGKESAGVYELIDAVRSAFVKGEIKTENTSNLELMMKLLSGMSNGKVSSKSIVPPVIIDFRNHCKKYRIQMDKANEVRTVLNIVKDKKDFEKSKFFHRMYFLDINFCVLEKGPDYIKKIDKNLARETWKYNYKTQVEAYLIDKSVFGVTIEEVCSNIIIEALSNNINAYEVSKLIIKSNVMGLYNFLFDNYDRIESIILHDNDFISLCKCLNNLSYINNLESMNDNFKKEIEILFEYNDISSIIESLSKQTFTLAIINMESIKNIKEEDALKISHHIKDLYSFTLENTNYCDIELFNNTIDSMLENTFGSSHIYAVCLALKYKSGRLCNNDFINIVSNFLESSDPESSSYFLNGIFLAARDILFINNSIINSIDKLIKNIDEEKFLEILPNLRYAFTNLSPKEIERLSEIISKIYDIKKEKILIDSNVSAETMHQCISIDEHVFSLIVENLL